MKNLLIPILNILFLPIFAYLIYKSEVHGVIWLFYLYLVEYELDRHGKEIWCYFKCKKKKSEQQDENS